MKFFIRAIYVSIHTFYVITQYMHHKTPTNTDLYLHENSLLQNAGNMYHETEIVDKKSACAHYCALDHGKCKSVQVVERSFGIYYCKLYKLPGKIVFADNPGYSVVSFQPTIEQSSYCEELDYLNICGSCVCKNQHGKKRMPYVCDCSNVTPIRKDCKDYHNNGHARSGIYRIVPNIKSFLVFCIMRKKQEALTTIFRRIDEVEYPSGDDRYNNTDAIHGDHMLGVEYIHQLTTAFKMDLYVETYLSDYNKYTATYKDFTVATKEDDYMYDYKTFDKTGGNLYNRFFTHALFNPGKSSAKFQKCSGEFYWWYCSGEKSYFSPTLYDYGIVMYLNRSDESS